ncbi:MAG: 3-methyl-2-oxobutanoate hydroxymethyltransferase [Polyangiaceae bacterium]|nr:3-methyl-2-oxobutanoate hydroxymethyltransferase [Polyangiaceae bacterium]
MYGPRSSKPGREGADGQSTAENARPRPKVTVPAIRARKVDRTLPHSPNAQHADVRPIAMITAYDFTMARLLDEGGADILLVGDSLGMVVQGHDNTLGVTVEEICYHGRAVARGAKSAHVVGDMPFMSFQVSPVAALENAGKMMKDGGFESIKLEGGVEYAEHVHRIVRAGIPVMGHVGLLPQSVHAMGGFKVQGKREDDARRVLRDAKALEDAGAYAIVLEAIPPDLAAQITESINIPTIGIGAGAGCDGQVLVCYDLLGMYKDLSPKFAKRFGEIGDAVVGATQAYVEAVATRSFPGPEHSFKPNGFRVGNGEDTPEEPPHAVH